MTIRRLIHDAVKVLDREVWFGHLGIGAVKVRACTTPKEARAFARTLERHLIRAVAEAKRFTKGYEPRKPRAPKRRKVSPDAVHARKNEDMIF